MKEHTDKRVDDHADLGVLVAAAGSEHVSTSLLDVTRLSHDASHYRQRPRAIVTAQSAGHVAEVMRAATRAGLPITFRAGGTSLSGQAVTDGVLVDVRRRQGRVEVLDGGRRVRCAPGAVLRTVNAALARHGRRLGPDPASESACTIGGVVANNSSGMTSSTTATVYRTLESMVLVLPSGTVLDTSAPDADALLRHAEPRLYEGLVAVRDRVRSRPHLRAQIERQFSMKNTMGYALNSLLDFDRPSDILAHLVVGSEGTLAYVAEVVLRTVPVLPHVATSLLVFDSIERAVAALPELTASGAAAAELLDAASLRVAQGDPHATDLMRQLRVTEHSALLVELQDATEPGLIEQRVNMERVLANLNLSAPAELSSEPRSRAAMWAVRKGLYAAVAGARPQGTTALLEDVVVPPAQLAGTVRKLRGLLAQRGYTDAVTFGHAKDANLHFMLNPRLDQPAELRTFEAFTEDLVGLVLGAGGSLKAEHGTGRMMAPFVRRQYGDELYEVMWELKRLCDPGGVLNPGVILSEDPRAHLRKLKLVPAVDPEVDACVDCGYCEPACPSRNTTTTPRQRIALLREIALAQPAERAELERSYGYAAVQTCAADSLCVRACPVGIDTGAVMKRMRADSRTRPVQTLGERAARSWGPVTTGLRTALGAADAVPSSVLSSLSRAARAVVGTAGRDWLPEAGAGLPAAGRSRSLLVRQQQTGLAQPDLVFFPACIGSLFAAEGGTAGVSSAFVRLCERAGLRTAVPSGIDGLCCGTVWESKGLVDGAVTMAQRVADEVWHLTDSGRLPVVVDASSCTHGLAGIGKRLRGQRAEQWSRVNVMDAVTFTRQRVLPDLTLPPEPALSSLMVHPTCSTTHLGIEADLQHLARTVARTVEVPVAWGCCGMAGDRGMLHPELTAGATEAEAAEIAALEDDHGPYDAYASCNRTCEMGMTSATGRPYRHILELLEEATR